MLKSLNKTAKPSPYDELLLPTGGVVGSGSHLLKQQAILKHSTHFADLVLYGAASPTGAEANEMRRIIISLVGQIKIGTFDRVNEKMDGSPAIVFGFNEKELPFVAYKGRINGTGKNLLFTNEAEVREHYSPDNPLCAIFSDCANTILPALNPLKSRFKNYLFQSDLLFTEANGAKNREGGAIVIKANRAGIAYRIEPEHQEYEKINEARLGLVVHTVSKREIDLVSGTLRATSINDDEAIEQVSRAVSSKDIYAIHPWRTQVPVAKGATLTQDLEAQVGLLLGNIEQTLASLSPQFREAWQKALRHLQVFFNGDLYPPNQGGIYRLAASAEAFEFTKFTKELDRWLKSREKGRDPKSGRALRPQPKSIRLNQIAPLLKEHRPEFKAVLESYFGAIKVQCLLKPFMTELYRSKLGGGPAEGIMIGQVKLVDRLDFTTKNFSVDRRPRRFSDRRELPKPLNRWQPQAAFFIAKLQPPHIGHVAAIRQAVKMLQGRPLYVLASDKAPNLKADHWRKLGVAPTKRELKSQSYTHPFSLTLRRRILSAAFGKDVRIHFVNPAAFWEHLRRAEELELPGKITLIAGTKEVAARRYTSQLETYASRLEIMPIQMQAAGISATSIRRAVAKLSKGDNPQAARLLDKGLSFIDDRKARAKIAQALIREWAAVSRLADPLL